MARIPVALLLEFAELGVAAFAKGRKIRKIAALLEDSPERAAAFKAARDKLDAAQLAGLACTLTVEETDALDFAMDMFSKKARKARAALNL